jgi:hypothetical protein
MYSKKNWHKRLDIISQLRQEFPHVIDLCYEDRWEAVEERATELCREAREEGYKLSSSKELHDSQAAITMCARMGWLG